MDLSWSPTMLYYYPRDDTELPPHLPKYTPTLTYPNKTRVWIFWWNDTFAGMFLSEKLRVRVEKVSLAV